MLAPIGLSADVAVSQMVSPASNEVGYDEPNIGPTPFAPNTNTLVPAVNGGEGLITQLFDAPSGLMTSAQAMATFIHSNAVWGIGARAAGSARSGAEAGSIHRMVTEAGGKAVSALDKPGNDISSLIDGVAW